MIWKGKGGREGEGGCRKGEAEEVKEEEDDGDAEEEKAEEMKVDDRGIRGRE